MPASPQPVAVYPSRTNVPNHVREGQQWNALSAAVPRRAAPVPVHAPEVKFGLQW